MNNEEKKQDKINTKYEFEYKLRSNVNRTTSTSKITILRFQKANGQHCLQYQLPHGINTQFADVSKSWLNKQRISLLRDFLITMFGYNKSHILPMKRKQCDVLIYGILGFEGSRSQMDYSQQELQTIGIALGKYTLEYVLKGFEAHLFDDPFLVDSSHQILQFYCIAIIGSEALPAIVWKLWSSVNCHFANESIAKFNDWIDRLFLVFEKLIDNEIHELSAFQKSCTFKPAPNKHLFLTTLLNKIESFFFEQARKIVVDTMYDLVIVEASVTDYQCFAFAGAAITSLLKTYYNQANSDESSRPIFIAYIRLFIVKDWTEYAESIPDRLLEENRGGMRILNPVFAASVGRLLSQHKAQMFQQVRLYTQTRLDKMCNELITDQSAYQATLSVYIEIYGRQKSTLGEFNETIFKVIYEKFVKHILSKATWAILGAIGHKKDDVSLRGMLKVHHVNKGKQTNVIQKKK